MEKDSPLSPNAQVVFDRKYAKTKPNGKKETWHEASLRVAADIAEAEETEEKKTEYTARFFQLISELVFLPGGRTLANAGTSVTNRHNCYVLPLEDNRAAIYKTLADAAEIFSQGGGIGIDYSALREKGHPLSTGVGASGPVAFMELFDSTGDLINEYNRRAAMMAYLSVSHPDVIEFITSKAQLDKVNERVVGEYEQYGGTSPDILSRILLDNQLTHMNISVMVTDEFMEAVEQDLDWDLISPKDGEVKKTLKAREIFDAIAQRCWESGDPGIGFYDRINKDNVLPHLGDITSSNPCGEEYMLPGESCCLGTLNLMAFFDPKTKGINYEFLEYATRTAIRFLDNAVTVNHVGIDYIDEITKGTRRVGLGLMGWADLLSSMEIPYDSDEAYELARYLSWFTSFFALLASNELAEERGEFPLMDREKADLGVIDKILNSEYTQRMLGSVEGGPQKFDTETFKLRNVSVTNVAPTGTLAVLAGVSSGIEPHFLLGYRRAITGGEGNTAKQYLTVVNEVLLNKLSELGYDEEFIEKVKEGIAIAGTLRGDVDLPEKLRGAFRTTEDIDPESHVRMLAAFQDYRTASISKTINLPELATVKDVKDAIMLGWKLGVKSMALYRDNSKVFQILTK